MEKQNLSRTTLPAWIVLLVAAPFIGSFLGVVIMRNADFASIAMGRSHCDACNAVIRPTDLIPIVGWLSLRGRCRTCGSPISWFHPAIELAALAPVVWAATLQAGWLLALSAIFGWFLVTLSLIDLRVFRLPDVLTLPLLVLGLASAWFFDRARWMDHLIGAAASFLVFAVLAFAYRRLRGRDGLGLGDAKFAAALGAFVAWQGMPGSILIAAILGLLSVLFRAVLEGRSSSERIPFGPFLAAGAWISWLYGPLMLG